MDVRDYLSILRDRWLLITSCVLVTVAISAAATFSVTPQYASSTRLFISTSGSTDDIQANQGGQFSLQRVKSYAELVNGQQISRRVIAQLDLNESPRALAEQISAKANLDTVILTITVKDPSPRRAKELSAAVGDQFVAYVAELETPPGATEATIKATVVDEAQTPGSPVSPLYTRNIVLGLILGLLLGGGLAVLREILDNTIKTKSQLEDLIDAPVLGGIPFESSAGKVPLITDLELHDSRVEGFRILRTNLQFVDPDENRKVFVVTSSVPAEGKTTTAANLAITLARGGERVVLVEADMRRPRVSAYLKAEGSVGLTTVLVGRVPLDQALQESGILGMAVLSSGRVPPNPAELIKSQSMSNIITRLRADFDIVLIDAPPLLPVTDAALLADQADGVVLVVRHGKTTIEEVSAASERLAAVGAVVVGAVFNMTRQKGGETYSYGYAPEPAAKVKQSKRSAKGRRRS